MKANARLVARGFGERPGINYQETLAPDPATPCIRLMAAMACALQSDLCHFAVRQAFVQAKLKVL